MRKTKTITLSQEPALDDNPLILSPKAAKIDVTCRLRFTRYKSVTIKVKGKRKKFPHIPMIKNSFGKTKQNNNNMQIAPKRTTISFHSYLFLAFNIE